jgi:hypothetical protein
VFVDRFGACSTSSFAQSNPGGDSSVVQPTETDSDSIYLQSGKDEVVVDTPNVKPMTPLQLPPRLWSIKRKRKETKVGTNKNPRLDSMPSLQPPPRQPPACLAGCLMCTSGQTNKCTNVQGYRLHQPHGFRQDIDESNAAKIAAARELADQAVADLAENSDATIPYATEALQQLRRADALAAPHYVQQAQDWKAKFEKLQGRFQRLSAKYTKIKAENAANDATIAWLNMRVGTQEDKIRYLQDRVEVSKWHRDVIKDLYITCKNVLGM